MKKLNNQEIVELMLSNPFITFDELFDYLKIPSSLRLDFLAESYINKLEEIVPNWRELIK